MMTDITIQMQVNIHFMSKITADRFQKKTRDQKLAILQARIHEELNEKYSGIGTVNVVRL